MRQAILIILLIFMSKLLTAQSLPANSCGIMYTYDAAGNRTKREYYCNTFQGPAPTQYSSNGSKASLSRDSTSQQENNLVKVDALYPNPNDGKFLIRFNHELKNAQVILRDVNGKLIQSFKASGLLLKIDISKQASGIYFLSVIEGANVLTEKVIKEY